MFNRQPLWNEEVAVRNGTAGVTRALQRAVGRLPLRRRQPV